MIFEHQWVEPITVVSVETEGDKTVVIGSGGLCFWRPTSHFRFMPEVGELFYMTYRGTRIISMQRSDGGAYAFSYSPEQLKAQDEELLEIIKEEEN